MSFVKCITSGLKVVATLVMLACAYTGTAVAAAEEEAVSFDGLVRVESSTIAIVFKNPDADFSVFQRVAILEPYVAFRSNWERDQNRSRTRNIRASDVERIRADVAALFLEVFKDRLEAGGYEVVEEAAEDVLELRPAIIDLDITAPEVRTAGQSRSYTTSGGAATLLLELFDSLSGQIIGRGIDRQAANRSGGRVSWSNRITNTADARRMFQGWADALVAKLKKSYTE